ncbi:MAG: hypothetical protein E4H14_02395 [Candidatus Thorarchaeota archaeon]|nr:MAG: hypothetical protein E4H14_02395 [Candidatus Thorarchaeota archaeon]
MSVNKDLLDKLDSFISLFEERDSLYKKSTETIILAVENTALAALYELFDVPKDDVAWMEVQLFEDLLLLICSITYDGKTEASSIIQQLAPVPAEITHQPHARIIRIGVPLQLIFSSKKKIIKYMNEQVAKQFPKDDGAIPADENSTTEKAIESESSTIAQDGFNSAELSREQVEQLLLMRHTLTRTKQ